MLGYDLSRWHAAVNDLPAALLLAAVLFDLAGWVLKRDSLVWAGIWSLWAGVVGGWAAVILGELAEDAIEHGDAIHEQMKHHETWALVSMSVFTLLLGWKLLRRFQLRAAEDRLLKVLSIFGLAVLVRTGMLGGSLVFDHAAGIPTTRLEAEIENRAEGHHHEEGESDEHEHGAAGADTAHDDSAPHPHQDPPGTPPHEH